MSEKRYCLGLDFGTGSVRALVAETTRGAEIADYAWDYRHGDKGVVVSPEDPRLARQDPRDYLAGTHEVIRGVLAEAVRRDPDFTPGAIAGIGVDTTGSTPMPVDADGAPLSFDRRFRANPNALAWLWKDHTAVAEAEEITARARDFNPALLNRCGGRYSSEWFFAKILRLLRVDPEVFHAAASFVELADWVPALLCGASNPGSIRRSVCAAGHKALYDSRRGGLPPEEFLVKLDRGLAGLRGRLYERAWPAGTPAGALCPSWAETTGLPAGVAVSVGAFDAHLGAVGSGIGENGLVKVIGTSTCDLMVFPRALEPELERIEGMCGLAEDSILPGYVGLEAGQSAVGDIFAWFAEQLVPPACHEAARRENLDLHQYLSAKAAALRPGESGLLALDWNNGNRSVLVDQSLSGLLVGQTLATRPWEVYRALVEATGFGARVIIDRIESAGVRVGQVIVCGGITRKNHFLLQVYSNILNREIKLAASNQTCALGAAIAGAVAAGPGAGGFASFAEGQARLCRFESREYRPEPDAVKVYGQLYTLYRQLHDAFGPPSAPLRNVMAGLSSLRGR